MPHEQTQFCRLAFPWNIEIEWQGKVGFHRIDDERVARIELSEGYGTPTVGHYVGMTVTIQSVKTGKIAGEYFSFNVFLSDVARIDTRRDMPGKNYLLIDYCGWHWYIHVPATTAPFVEAVESYIDQFRIQHDLERYAFVCDKDASGLPQVLIVKPTVGEIVKAAKDVYDAEYPGDDTLPEDEEWSFWVDTTGRGHFDKLGHFTDHAELVGFFEK